MNVIIMRGIPGSGKSTWIKNNHKPGDIVCSSDHFHMIDGVYQWKPENTKKAHAHCLMKYTQWVNKWWLYEAEYDTRINDTCIVDNTNLSVWEIAPYYALAEAYGATVKIVSFKLRPETARLVGGRNVHNVPESTIDQMYLRMADAERQFPRHWNVEYIKPVLSEVPA